ncbi:MAG TPA: metallophosphoesterase [Burkholderiales bacterium]|jgi:3',5'-cyclic AMP phosphodiesterase CpdA|nr:metallophosphoesterase [Burkholderiales bacterium]
MARIIQISDTHLSRSKPQFALNWPPLRDWVRQQQPDLVIHTGDLTVDGADRDDDMRDGAQLMGELGLPFLAVPGNHDIGEADNIDQPVNETRLARWRRHFGPDWWSRDIEAWRLVGLDSMLFGSGCAEEAHQMEWLHETLANAGARRIALFTHRPLFIEDPQEGDRGYWSLKPEQRAPMLDLIRHYGVALVATGHLHKWHDTMCDGCRYVWCPSSGFLVGPQNQPELPGSKSMGAIMYELDGARLVVRHADVPGLTTLWIDDVLHEVYPPRRAA